MMRCCILIAVMVSAIGDGQSEDLGSPPTPRRRLVGLVSCKRGGAKRSLPRRPRVGGSVDW